MWNPSKTLISETLKIEEVVGCFGDKQQGTCESCMNHELVPLPSLLDMSFNMSCYVKEAKVHPDYN